MDDYVEVSERIEKFYTKHPTGSLQCKEVRVVRDLRDKDGNPSDFLLYIAQAFRTPDDPRPGQGVAWEPIPGKTNFTRDSEAMNAETSAWGRAIAGLGFEVRRGIASANEVRNRQAAEKPQTTPDEATKLQKAAITRRCNELNISDQHKPQLIDWAGGMPLTETKAAKLIKLLMETHTFGEVWTKAGLPNPQDAKPQTLEDALLEGGSEALGLQEANDA